MRSFRFWLLLLVVLVPLRGALAAAMPCAGLGGMPAQGATYAHQHADGAAHGHDHDHLHHDETAATSAGDPAATDKCDLCSASCAATALVGEAVRIAAARPPATVFAPCNAAPPSFVSGGPERPPRTT